MAGSSLIQTFFQESLAAGGIKIGLWVKPTLGLNTSPPPQKILAVLMTKSYQDIIESLNGLSFHDLFRLECHLYLKIDDPELTMQVKRQIHVGDMIQYFNRDENRLIEAQVLNLMKTRILVKNTRDGKKWKVLYASICFDADAQGLIGKKSSQEKLRKTDVQVGDLVSFFDNNERELMGQIVKLNIKTASILTETGANWRVAYGHLTRVIEGEAGHSGFVDIKLLDE